MPERYRLLATLGAGLGLRQGELFGLAVGDIDRQAGVVTVRRQVKIVGSRPVFAPPKNLKVRTVPLPKPVAQALAAHQLRYPPTPSTLPWRDVDGRDETATLLVTSRELKPLNRNYFNGAVWHKALEAVGIEPSRQTGMHQLRHWYASTLLEAGASIKAVSEYLGHTDPGFTLHTYTHLMPSSDDPAREAIAAAFAHDRDTDTVAVTDG